MAFFEERMDTDLSFGARGGPVFSTAKAYSVSGRRMVNRQWAAPLHRYDVAPAIRSLADFETLRNFFYVVSGAFDGFRFKDWTDFMDGGRGVLTLVSGSNYQMFKTYTRGSRTFNRKIGKPVSGTVQIFRLRSSVETNITLTSSIDHTTGLVTVTGHAAGDTYRWTGEFDVPVAFQSDEFMSAIVDRGGDGFLIDPGQVMLEELRL